VIGLYSLNMRILITGDRHWRCHDLAEQILNRLLARYGPDLTIIHGGAAGVDNAFSVACEGLGITAEPHLADWKGGVSSNGTENRRKPLGPPCQIGSSDLQALQARRKTEVSAACGICQIG
jgi:YspA, cpYpsA-related SLOG family